MKTHKPIVLVVLDGWGDSPEKSGNAIAHANLPTIKLLDKNYPKTLLQASGISVGLPWEENGNSEIGHQTIGSGQIYYQNLPRIFLAIEDGSFFKNEVLIDVFLSAARTGKAVHFLGLLSDGGVHSHIDHLLALLEMAKDKKVKKNYIHAFTDGRDTGPKTATSYLERLRQKVNHLQSGQIATVCGRFYGMDRNKNWDRTKLAYEAMVNGLGIYSSDPVAAVRNQYDQGITDEFIKPIVITSENGDPIAKIKSGDALVFFNFREDRARQISEAFCKKNFREFEIKNKPDIEFIGMIPYEDNLPMKVAFPPLKFKTCLGKILEENGKKQLRIAETEKYAHVTYFFNCGCEKPFEGEKRILIPSKDVDTYDRVPQMSAREITDRAISELNNDYDFILINYANPDMVGHTGNLQATIKAVQEVDRQLSALIPEVLKIGGCLLITADHGNAEELINFKTGEKDTEHSSNPVPFWLVTPDNSLGGKSGFQQPGTMGIISDITPTILELMGIDVPKEMKGDSLLELLK